ncbi:terminase small subunit-like protein [Escherichia sp. MOD1-EC5451]|uniref:terminase small subunit-like protein n=1 Tax=Escherichia sp. MOD1-EC5451 TaxID=2093873 RepID=UPI00313CEA55
MTDNLPQTPATGDSRTSKGRPTKYNDRIAQQICLYVAQGMSLRKISRQPGMPSWAQLNVWRSSILY